MESERLRLRDLQEEDLPVRFHWNTVETEWMLWDGPWESEGKSQEELYQEAIEANERLKKRLLKVYGDNEIRRVFEIELKENKEYIGCVSSYNIDEDCNINEEGNLLAIGMAIPERKWRRQGLGFEAMKLVIGYYFDHGFHEIYTQTWSGNIPMIKLAEKLGFQEFRRKKDFRFVRGAYYDGLTFKKDKD